MLARAGGVALAKASAKRSPAFVAHARRLQSSLAYRVFEHAGAAPTKTAVVMHGILGNKLNWRTFSMKLAAAFPDWRFVAVDHRGHGESPSLSAPHSIEACANDVIELADALRVVPDAVFGHSFGGKVALQYLATCAAQARPLPRQVWVLDSLPGTAATDYKNRRLTASIENVLPRLKEVPLPIRSKAQLVKDLTTKGIGLGEAQWLTTNLRLVSNQPEAYEWKMDVAVVEQLFDAFLATDLWPVVRARGGGGADRDTVEIHFVHAEKNTMWTPAILRELDGLAPANSPPSHRLPPALPTQFSADVSIVSHLTDPRQRYPPSSRLMRIQYDWEQQVAKAEMRRGFEANKTYVRRYDQRREYMVKHGRYSKCERAYLGVVSEHWMHAYANVRVHIYSDLERHVPIRLTEENVVDGVPTMLLTYDLENVALGPQRAADFAIPDGYAHRDCERNVGGFPYIHAFHYYLRF
ncbi:hypothetical protein PybrP1_012122 [[Pythium] brassicae (nom. inval.)]|nr:hypothetical protein PybrP1_012122 [[Pythium] brassicae (nom. inval.)]